MSDNFFIDVIIIVTIQSTLLLIYNIVINKYKNNKDPLSDNLKIVRAILESTKHEKILSLDRIKEIESSSDEVFVFSKDMFRDVKNSGQFSDEAYNVGTFYSTVKENLKNTDINYTYFLKKDSHWKHFIHSFKKSYENIINIDNRVKIFMIPADKYFFYDEIYLYRVSKGINKNKYIAFEFLPSISNEKDKLLFYLELGDKQVDRLIDIKEQLISSYKEEKLSELLIENK